MVDVAIKQTDPIKRLAYLGLFLSVNHTNIEKCMTKPFNPLLGETFEFVIPGQYKYIAEQVSHHPPITAYVVLGDSGYIRDTVVYGKTRFAKGGMEFVNQYQEYIEFPKYKERFLLEPAPISVHNLIIGTPYLDVGGRAYMRNLKCPKEQYVEITFFKRNWSGDNNFRVTASVFSAPGKIAYRIEGRWNDEVFLMDANTGKKEYTWKKPAYPDNSEYMYGMTHHHL